MKYLLLVAGALVLAFALTTWEAGARTPGPASPTPTVSAVPSATPTALPLETESPTPTPTPHHRKRHHKKTQTPQTRLNQWRSIIAAAVGDGR